jgi:hypothetical protein
VGEAINSAVEIKFSRKESKDIMMNESPVTCLGVQHGAVLLQSYDRKLRPLSDWMKYRRLLGSYQPKIAPFADYFGHSRHNEFG